MGEKYFINQLNKSQLKLKQNWKLWRVKIFSPVVWAETCHHPCEDCWPIIGTLPTLVKMHRPVEWAWDHPGGDCWLNRHTLKLQWHAFYANLQAHWTARVSSYTDIFHTYNILFHPRLKNSRARAHSQMNGYVSVVEFNWNWRTTKEPQKHVKNAA